MRKLPAVEQARALFTEAMDWGVWRWLLEKRRVRATADQATDALYDYEDKVKGRWPEDLRLAYDELVDTNQKSNRRRGNGKKPTAGVAAEIVALARKIKQADDEAYAARMEAEDIFAEAERVMSIPMAKLGAQRTLESYDLHEKAIRRAEAGIRTSI